MHADARGSIWHRWDPHIHTPGTILSNHFPLDSWEEYLNLLESSDPKIEALGITDYCSLDRYEEVLAHKSAGRIPEVGLVFPNVEMRLPIPTVKGQQVNVHLLICPDDLDHVEQARRFLRGLKFEYRGEQYACERPDLMRLGRLHDSTIGSDSSSDRKALEEGTNQFKVTPDALKAALKSSAWAQRNIIIGVAGSRGDGTAGLQTEDGAFAATRQEIERMSSVIFASSPKQRVFWLGAGAESIEELESRWGGLKACLHGSDAHRLELVGKPDEDRYTWIKGDLTFESLRQACIEPAERVIVAPEPPERALEYRTIDTITLGGAGWAAVTVGGQPVEGTRDGEVSVPLNPGLVAIVGARGSGKTALADMIAAGAGAFTNDRASDQSFVRRAREHLIGARVALGWGDGSTTESVLPPGSESPMHADEPGGSGDGQVLVQYLSQQFVEQLCSSEGIADELLSEVERVIFESHPYEGRLGASSFGDLLDLKAAPGRLKRSRAHEDMATLVSRIDSEREALAELPAVTARVGELEQAIKADKAARQGLLLKGGEERSERLEQVNAAVMTRQAEADSLARQQRALTALRSNVEDLRERRFPAITRELEAAHADAGLTPEEWAQFRPSFLEDPSVTIDDRLRAVRARTAEVSGPQVPRPETAVHELPPFVEADADLATESLNQLRAEAWRLAKLIGLDEARARQLSDLNARIAQAETTVASLKGKLDDAKGAKGRIAELTTQRQNAYASLFDGFAEEQAQLSELYAPLRDMLAAEEGTLGKLSFTVRRVVAVRAWADQGEGLMDLRTAGPFKGHGELLKAVEAELLPAWLTGTSVEVASAMASFRDRHDSDILAHAPASKGDPAAYWAWGKRIGAWLNSSDHISIQYGIQYDGVDIEQLSPGTRGIVLLLLYLSIDQLDDRPLLIDQPEENLDPQSIFTELVHRFRTARVRRQIIIVTHNANLVVNTDADQVIVASAGAHKPGQLPDITYSCGGLENTYIREQVCEILEGGRRAFEERARRLRFSLA